VSYFPEVDLGPSFLPYAVFREYCGFVPSVYRAQSALPRLIEAECKLASALTIGDSPLTHYTKELILLALAGVERNSYCAAAQYQLLSLLGEPEDKLERLLGD
jgi:hypothetical protein